MVQALNLRFSDPTDNQHELGKATVHGRLPALSDKVDLDETVNRWPHLGRFLKVDSLGGVDGDFAGWSWCVEAKLSPGERAAAYEEWADFWEWRLVQREPELARDRRMRHLVAKWTDSMTYSCRRSAAWARGEDPGAWVPQSQRRPDLYAEGQAIVVDIIAGLDPRHQPVLCPVMAG